MVCTDPGPRAPVFTKLEAGKYTESFSGRTGVSPVPFSAGAGAPAGKKASGFPLARE